MWILKNLKNVIRQLFNIIFSFFKTILVILLFLLITNFVGILLVFYNVIINKIITFSLTYNV